MPEPLPSPIAAVPSTNHPIRRLRRRLAATEFARRWLGCLITACALPLPTLAAPALPEGAEIFQWVQGITAFGVRRPGSPASMGASQYVHDRFVEFGLERVAFESADTKVWQASRWGLSVDGLPVPVSPMQHTFTAGQPKAFNSGPAGIQGELAYVGRGTAADFLLRDVRGKIVVADVSFGKRPMWLFKPFLLGLQDSDNTFGGSYTLVDPYAGGSFPFSYYFAQAKGAAGFIGVLTDYFDSHQYRNEAYNAYDPGLAMRLPGLWMSPLAGGQLVDRIQAATFKRVKPQGTLTLQGRLDQAQARAVVGYLPGMSDEIILIQSHHDSVTTGATEDASGTAAVLALARYFSQLPREQRPRTLMFATMDSHFTDYAVHKAFAKRHLRLNNPLGEKVVAVLTVEHIAREWLPGTDRQPQATGLPAPRAMLVSTEIPGFKDIALSAIRTHQVERTIAIPIALSQLVSLNPGIPADSSDFLKVGVPVIALVGAPLYLYDEMDTPDKVDVDDLGRVTKAFADIVQGLSALPSANFRRLPDLADF